MCWWRRRFGWCRRCFGCESRLIAPEIIAVSSLRAASAPSKTDLALTFALWVVTSLPRAQKGHTAGPSDSSLSFSRLGVMLAARILYLLKINPFLNVGNTEVMTQNHLAHKTWLCCFLRSTNVQEMVGLGSLLLPKKPSSWWNTSFYQYWMSSLY